MPHLLVKEILPNIASHLAVVATLEMALPLLAARAAAGPSVKKKRPAKKAAAGGAKKKSKKKVAEPAEE